MRERGSATLVVAATLGFAAIFAALLADLSQITAARARVQGAADAAALAAAQELVLPTERSPAEVAADYAARAGTRLVSCQCASVGRDVVVVVEATVDLPFLRRERDVHAAARAVVEVPVGAQGLEPSFAAGLACLFLRVPGLRIVSGFRTPQEQALLHHLKPGLAAPPGRSMHERGLAADLSFPSPSAQLAAHSEAAACGVGFPLAHEPWHAEPAA